MKTLISTLLLLTSLHSFANDSFFDGTQEMTEAEEQEAEVYLHQGKAQKKYDETCLVSPATETTAAVYKDECTNDQSAFAEGSNYQKIEEWMPMVTKAYTMLSGLASQSSYIKKQNGSAVLVDKNDGKTELVANKEGKYFDKDGKAVDPKSKDYDKKTEKKTDYCSKIPMATEAAAVAYQGIQNKQTEAQIQSTQGSQTQQAEAFYALAKTHKDIAKSSTIQAAGFGTTAACYTALAATNVIAGDVGTIAKAGAALLLTTFYTAKVKAHKERSKWLTEKAKEFPQAGECNPHTQTTCFCNEDSSQYTDPANYLKYCKPSSLHADTADSYICVDQNNQADPSCSCKSKGTCLSANFAKMNSALGISPSLLKNPFAGLSPLSSGFGVGDLQSTTDKNAAFAKKKLEDLAKELPSFKLNDKQKEMAKALSTAGLPKMVAAALASTNGTGSLPSSLAGGAMGTGKLGSSGNLNGAMASVQKAEFKKGNETSSSNTKKSAYSSPFDRFKKSNSSSGANKVEILDFAEKAQREAEITKDTSRPIFDIITYRYKASAWREFQDTINKEQQLEESTQK